MVTSFCGHVAFIGFISELRSPATFPKALAVTEVAAAVYYCVIAALVYHFAGDAVASPAINSAPAHWRLAAWCVAMPTIVVAGVINMHVATKQMNWKRVVGFVVNLLILVIGIMIFVVGMYTSGIALAHGEGGKPFSCKI
ncbi:MAG: hypothetical protein Q9157_007371 [Trypethelium eluteriae]